MLENADDQDLKDRFCNCIIAGDLAYNFFVGKLEAYLDNDDMNRLSKQITEQTGGHIYNIERNSFQGNSIKSKVRFLMDQLIRETLDNSAKYNDGYKERTSAWLLLSLSSHD